MLGGQAVGEHHAAERAADRDLVGTCADGFLGAVDVDALTDVLLHPHARATGAAAEGLLGVALHLGERRAGQDLEQLARRRVDVVVTAEEARIVVGDRALGSPGTLLDRCQLALAHEPVEQLRVVDDLELDAEVLVLVLQRVEAVGAGRDDLLDLVLLERLDVLLCEALEDELVAGTASRVTRAGFAVAEYAEGDPGDVEELSDSAGGLLGAVLIGARAADPEEPVHGLQRLEVLADDGDVELEALGPVHARGGGHAPRVALVLQCLEQAVELGGEVGLHQHLVAAHVHDVIDVFDVDGALLDARTTRGAGPQDVLVDDEGAVGGVVEVVQDVGASATVLSLGARADE